MKSQFSQIQCKQLQQESNCNQLSQKICEIDSNNLNKTLQASRKNIIKFFNQLSVDQRQAINLARDYQEIELSENDDRIDCLKILQFVDNTIRKMKNNKKMKKNWNKQDLTILLFVIQKYNLKFSKKTQSYEDQDWINIAQYVPGKNHLQCMFKWLGLKKNNLNEFPWTELQEKQLLRLVSEKGTNKWLQVSQKLYLQNNNLKIYRSSKQCRQHWTCYMDPKLKKGPWSPEQDLELLKYFLKIGKKWSQISKMLNGRTQNAVKNRFNLIMDKKSKTGSKSTITNLEYVNQLIMNLQVSLPLNPTKKYQMNYDDNINGQFNPFIDPDIKNNAQSKLEVINIQKDQIIQKINNNQDKNINEKINRQQSNYDDSKNLKIIKFKKMSLQELLQIDGVVPATFNKQTMEVVCKDVFPLKIKDISQIPCIINKQQNNSVRHKKSEQIFLQ